MLQTDDDWDADLGESVGKDPEMLGGGLGMMKGLSKVRSIEGRPTGLRANGDSPRKASGGVSPGSWEYPVTKKTSKGLKKQYEGLVRGNDFSSSFLGFWFSSTASFPRD